MVNVAHRINEDGTRLWEDHERFGAEEAFEAFVRTTPECWIDEVFAHLEALGYDTHLISEVNITLIADGKVELTVQRRLRPSNGQLYLY
jgi:hypothetical protein